MNVPMALLCNSIEEDPLDLRTLTARLGFSGPLLEVPSERHKQWCAGTGRHLLHAGDQRGVELLISNVHEEDLPALKRWTLSLARRAPLRRFVHIEMCSRDRAHIAMVQPGSFEASATVVRSLDEALVGELEAVTAVGREHMALRLFDVLGRELLTDRFFKAFRKQLLLLEGCWMGLPKNHSCNPSDDSADRFVIRDLTLALLCRLMFVTFLAREGFLGQERNYLRWALQQPRQGDIYRGVLRHLFFGALNTPQELRCESARRLGDLPFLNGGLFHPLSLERQNPDLTLPDEPLAAAMHALFERYDFTAKERAEREPKPAIDPQMLGQVFEALMHSDERRQSGTFYTPAGLVENLVKDVFVDTARGLNERLGRWTRVFLDGQAPNPLSTGDAERLDHMFSTARILDPAVGSGAFLLGALNALVSIRMVLQGHTGQKRSEYELRREAITRNLYGVDVKAGAVRLCELRLWLSLVCSAQRIDELAPLPNLDHHIRQGDSLLEPQLVRTRVQTGGHPACATTDLADYADLHGPDKDEAARERRQSEHQRLRALLDNALAELKRQRREQKQADAGPDLFGDPRRLSPSETSDRKRLDEKIVELKTNLRSVNRGELPFFSYEAAFPKVFERGGFEMILGNPPWVRPHDLAASTRARLRQRYRFARGLGSGFEGQVDLSVLFVERSLELARPGGVVGLLLPAKLFRARYGRVMRDALAREHQVVRFADLSLVRSRLFSASNYPAWLVARAAPPLENGQTRASLSTPDGCAIESVGPTRRLAAPGPTSDPWTALPATIIERFAKMAEGRVTLADYGLRATLGVKTGMNRAFLSKSWQRASDGEVTLTMSDGSQLDVSEEIAPLVCRGRDVRAFSQECEQRLLLAYNRRSCRPLRELPPQLETYFERHRPKLRLRRDSRGRGAPWSVFRTAGLQRQPRVIWRDIAPRLEAVFCAPSDAPVPFNTTYFFVPADEYEGLLVTALLNSLWVRLYAVAAAEQAMSGYFRFLAWTVERIPWPSRLKPGSRQADQLVALCGETHNRWTVERQAEIDQRVARAYGLDNTDEKALSELLRFFPGCVA